MKKTTNIIIAIMLCVPLLLPQVRAEGQTYPVPREQTVVIETDTSYTIWDQFNSMIPNGVQWGGGWHQICNEWDWYINYATGEIIYWRIEGWTYSADYTTVTFKVRRGVTWNDGQPYTAKDIAFTFNLLLANPNLFGATVAIEWVKSAVATDDYTCVIQLNKPNPRFHHYLRMWSGLTILAEHIWKGKDPTTYKNNPPVETGPYVLYKQYPDLNLWVWERNDNYWGKAMGVFPTPKYVIWRYAPPADVDLADFVAGGVDAPLPHLFSWEMIKTAMKQTPNVTIAPFLDPCPLGVTTMNLDVYPLNIREVRWAIAYCLNREKLAKLYPMANGSIPTPYPWAIPYYAIFYNQYEGMMKRVMARIQSELGYTFEYNPAKAKQILDGLGWTKGADGIYVTTNGTRVSLEIQTRPPSVVQEYYIGVDLAEELKAIGIDASVKTVDPAMYGELGALGQYQIAAGSLCTDAWLYGDIVGMLNTFHSKWYVPIGVRSAGGGVHGVNPRYKNPELDAVVDQLWSMGADAPGAAALYEQGLYLVTRDMLTIPATEKMFVQTFSSTYWTGWPTEKNMYHVPYTWWPEFIFVLARIQPVKVTTPGGTTTTVTSTMTTTATTTATTATTVTVSGPAAMDITSVAGAGIIALVVGVAVGWLLGSRKKQT